MNDDREYLLRYLEGALPEREASALEERLESEPALRARMERLRGVSALLQTSKPDGFAPQFSARVLARLVPRARVSPAEALYESLQWLFARTAVVGAAAAAILAVYNVVDYGQLGVAASVVEALFGLPSDALLDALSYGVM